MADSQSKIDAAAEKAFADAAAKKTAEAAKPAKATPAEPAPAKPAAAPVAEKVEAKPEVAAKAESTPAPKPAPVAKKAAPKKPAAKAKPAVKKPVASKPAPKKAAPKKIAAKKPVSKKAPAKKPLPVAAKTTKPDTTITELKDKIMATTKTTDFTAKIKDTLAEVQTRAKAAYEKGTEMTSEVTAFHKGNFDAIVESGKILASGMQDMGRTAVEEAKSAAETATGDVKAMAAIKSPTELFQLQGEIARRNLDTMVAKTSKNAEMMMKLANDMFAPLSTRASVAMEKLGKAA